MRTFEYKVEVNLSDDESDVPTKALNRLEAQWVGNQQVSLPMFRLRYS